MKAEQLCIFRCQHMYMYNNNNLSSLYNHDLDILTPTILFLFTIYRYHIGKIVNKQNIVCDKLSESR